MDVEKMRTALKRRLVELGISAREASRRAGFNVGYVGDILDGRSMRPDPEKILKLAESLDMDSVDLLSDSKSPRHASHESLPFGMERRIGGRMIPIYSAPIPMERQFVPFSEEPVGSMPCTSMLLDVPDAFAALVPNDACAPRFRQGETIMVNPTATPSVGDYVWVRCKDTTVAIARLACLNADSFLLEFPGLTGADATAVIDYGNVTAINRIVSAVF